MLAVGIGSIAKYVAVSTTVSAHWIEVAYWAALNKLLAERYLVARRGAGTYVANTGTPRWTARTARPSRW